jgi:ribosomal protein S18 acetylase RimI-like enzyme
MEGIIEKALAEDMREILDLQRKAFAPVAVLVNDMNIPPMTQTYEDMAGEYDQRYFLKYTLDGKIVGSVCGYMDAHGACQIERLIVDPDYQKRGIGQMLMREIERRFAGCDRYELFTGEKTQNTVRLYTRLGYEKTHTEDMDGVSLVYMRKDNGVRLAGEEDLPGIHALYDLATEWLDSQGIRQWNADVYPTYETARRAWEDGHLYCIGEDPVVATMVLNENQPSEYAGVPWKHGGRALVVHTLMVHPECAGRGLGKKLLAYADRLAMERGCGCIRIDVFPDNAAAMAMYKKAGYAFAGEIIFAYKEPGHQVYHCYEKKVGK